METIDSKLINDWLKTQGNIPLKTEPLFRLVWSTKETEVRIVTGYIYDGNRRIGVDTKPYLTRKYPWCQDRWVLEQWEPPEKIFNEELPDSKNGSYEPKYVFENTDGPLPLNIEPVKFLINILKRPASSPERIKSAIKEWFTERDKRIEKEDLDTLSDSTSMASLLHHKEAIIVPAQYDIESINLRNKQ